MKITKQETRSLRMTIRNAELYSSKSFIIRHVKTKKIAILISIDFDDFTSPFTLQPLFRLRRYIKHSRQCFIGYPNISNFVRNTPLRVVFSTFFLVFGYPDETLFLVLDVLLERRELQPVITPCSRLQQDCPN